MFRQLTFTLLILGFAMTAATAKAKISIFACEPEWGALAEEIGGDLVKVKNGTNAKQDAHFISVRPSLIAMVRKADLVICTGADLEIGWLPTLLRQSGNSKIQPGTAGYLAAADYVRKLEVPTIIDRALGDIHPQGNPHIIGDPRNVLIVARKLAERLAKIDPANRATYEQRLARFESRWLQAIAQWEAAAQPLIGLPIVVQHKTWVYLVEWLNMSVVSTLEPRPGIPPSTSHLQAVLKDLGESNPKFILNAAYENDRASEWLSERTNIPEITLPYTVGGSKQADDLFSLFDVTIAMLLEYAG